MTGDERATATVAVALAGVAAAAGTATALVECDVERPRLAADLGLEPTPGLHEYLRWEATPADVVQPLALAGSAAAERAGDARLRLRRPAERRPADPARPRQLPPHDRETARRLRAGRPARAAAGRRGRCARQRRRSVRLHGGPHRRPVRRAARPPRGALLAPQAPPLGAVVLRGTREVVLRDRGRPSCVPRVRGGSSGCRHGRPTRRPDGRVRGSKVRHTHCTARVRPLRSASERVRIALQPLRTLGVSGTATPTRVVTGRPVP